MSKNNIDLTKYLKELNDLEGERYRLEEIKKNVSRHIRDNLYDAKKEMRTNCSKADKDLENQKQKIYEEKSVLKSPVSPTKPKPPIIPEKAASAGIVVGVAIISVVLLFIPAIGPFLAIVGGAIAFGLGAEVSRVKREKETFRLNMIKYNSDLKNFEKQNEEYKKNKEIAEKEIKPLIAKCDKLKNEINAKYTFTEDELNKLREGKGNLIDTIDENLKVVNKKLDELYSEDIIFEKYRNMVAISTIYEYFISSRVDALGGRDGAYNLFESELRQNVIIVKLSQIVSNLEAIRERQYYMYQTLNSIDASLDIVNQNLKSISYNTEKISKTTDRIASTSEAILGCTREINKNMNKVKNIAVADFYLK